MDKMTLEALKASIAKWEMKVLGEELFEIGSVYCPLCKLFNTFDEKIKHLDCEGCPIFGKTAKNLCNGTPYNKYVKILRLYEGDSTFLEKLKKAAQEEVDFLKSLLPV